MKIVYLVFCALLVACCSYAQNTFPTTGSVGIGTTNPAYNLDVNGTIRATGNVTVPTINNQYIGSSSTGNVFIGGYVITGANNTSYGNVAIGYHILNADNFSGYQNVGVGGGILYSNTSGFANVGLGGNVLALNTTGSDNIAIGQRVLAANTVGSGSIAIGSSCLWQSTTANYNTAIGFYSGWSVTTGLGNTFLGCSAGNSVTTGNNNVVIGITTPGASSGLTTGSGNVIVGNYITGLSPALTNHIIIGDGQGHQRLVIDNNGNAGIGTLTPDSKLTVGGTVHATGVLIDQTVTQPDYVFEKDYNLATLKEVKTYIDKNHHLPEIPSASQVAKDGINLGEMDTKLLKKIEELTLYLIEKENELNSQKKQLAHQKRLIIAQQNQLNKINKKLSIN